MLFLLITNLQTMKSFTYTLRSYPLFLHYKKKSQYSINPLSLLSQMFLIQFFKLPNIGLISNIIFINSDKYDMYNFKASHIVSNASIGSHEGVQ